MSDDDLHATYRILDASANRAGEGLRTLEEFARFVLDDADTTAKLKSLRHDLASSLGHFSRPLMLAARDTPGDVGTEIRERSEYSRQNLTDVVAAAASRSGQSLRVLEEYGKTIDPKIAAEIEQLRYRCYTIAAALELRIPGNDRQQQLAKAQLYVLIDGGISEDSFRQSVRSLLRSGVDVLQLRDHQLDDRTLIARAKTGTEIAHEFAALFIVNDRADLALAADADGVHVGQEELPAPVARQIVGSRRLVGVSTHSIEQARDAVAQGADYIGCGPVFPGTTKTFDAYVGTALLSEVSRQITIPAFAIGGINAANVQQVVTAGVARIAVTGAVCNAENPATAAAELKSLLRGKAT